MKTHHKKTHLALILVLSFVGICVANILVTQTQYWEKVGNIFTFTNEIRIKNVPKPIITKMEHEEILLPITSMSVGKVTITFPAVKNIICSLQATPDLVNGPWTIIPSNTVSSTNNGPIQLQLVDIDPLNVLLSRRFYGVTAR